MNNNAHRHQTLDVDDLASVTGHYRAISEWLLAQSNRDIQYHLPNLVETIADRSEDTDTVRFVGGVSFTQKHTPLDYRLVRVYEPDDVDFYRQEPLKQPVSHDHHYVQFVYPPDPSFDASSLRTVLLTSIETAIHFGEESDDETVESGLSGLWQDL